MYMNGMKASNVGSCKLVSPVQRRTAGACVHFFYYTTGVWKLFKLNLVKLTKITVLFKDRMIIS